MPVEVAEVVDADDVGVLERCGGLRLVQESLAQVVLPRNRVVHHLDGDGAVQHRIPGFVHDTHRALAYELDYVVLTDVGNLGFGHAHSRLHGPTGPLPRISGRPRDTATPIFRKRRRLPMGPRSRCLSPARWSPAAWSPDPGPAGSGASHRRQSPRYPADRGWLAAPPRASPSGPAGTPRRGGRRLPPPPV